MAKQQPAPAKLPAPAPVDDPAGAEDETSAKLYKPDTQKLKQLASLINMKMADAYRLVCGPVVDAAVGGRTSGPLFATASGKRYPAQNIDGGLRRLLKSLGLPVRGSHILRHSVASHLVAAGVPLADVARFLGDSVEVIVRTYLHAVGTDPAAAIESMFGDDAK